jgi:valyl-tRNA synthetase
MNPKQLPSQYDHASAQERWYPFWESRGYFHPEADPDRPSFVMVIPPPNVTGALHLGHALNNTLQDVLVRQKRMQGYNSLWLPGTDHAGIATQAVVERRLLQEEKLSRHDLGRERLVAKIWDWKKAYETRIIGQLKQMGFSCDWQRLHFTLDDTCARAVRATFFRMFQQQLIYRGKRLVNWDTFLQTTVSDDEVFHDTVQGHFWHLRYPVIDPKPGEPSHVSIATTRPETMLGDTAVAVHPDPAEALDQAHRQLSERLATAPARERSGIEAELETLAQRRQTLLPGLLQLRDMARDGRMLMLPLMDRPIPLIVDRWAKPELGSGCVKITPAHDANDYEVGGRCGLPMVNILNPDGTLNENAGPYQGATVQDARRRVVADLDRLGLLAEVEDREIDLAHSDRSKTPIEPYLTAQWFVKMDQLAQSAMDAVTDGRVRIIPSRYAKGYIDWLSEKRDWPVGRQLWWGHRIPVWSRVLSAAQLADPPEFPHLERLCPDRTIQPVRQELQQALAAHLVPGPGEHEATLFTCVAPGHASWEQQIEQAGMVQEDDVLDTWFSSALWPHSTLGWPEQTTDLASFYPTSTLVTSRDIITLWVARMVLTGLLNMGEVPFRDVYIHPKILDGYGETMSKSKGNGVDPLDVIEKFGADALRFALVYLTTENQDVRMPAEFECPHCQAHIKQTKKNRVLPRLNCPQCGTAFATQWAEQAADKALPRAAVVSERFELGRNFCNKLWNASRFALLNLEGYSPAPVPAEALAVEDRWILSRLATVTAGVTAALEKYRYAEVARILYDFAWDEFCSFYVEMLKGRLQDDASRPVAQRVLAHTLDVLLRLLHPLIPFLTEEVWQLLAEAAPERGLQAPQVAAESIMIAAWPEVDPQRQDAAIEERFAGFQAVLGGLREVRSRQNIPPRQPVQFSIQCDAATAEQLRAMEPYFKSMARAEAVDWGADVKPPANAARVGLPGLELFVDLKDLIDVAAEITRKRKEEQKIVALIAGKEKKLANQQFVSRAPAAVVEQERGALADLEQQLASVQASLVELNKAKA